MTTFNDQLFQMGGIPVPLGGGLESPYTTSRNGRTWFVDANYGANGNAGNSWGAAFATMTKAFTMLASGDTIFFTGKLAEQCTTPVQVFDVSVIGVGNRPRHADSTPSGGQYATAQWGAVGGTAAVANVRVLQQGWRFQNILFSMVDTNAAAIEIVRNAGASDAERDASHAVIVGCKFAGAGVGIRSGATSFTENTHNVLVQGNTFLSNTYGLRQTAGFGGLNWQILDNMFISCTNDIVGPFGACKILRNSMSLAPTGSIILTGGTGNMVQGNFLPGTYAAGTLYAPGTSDNWNGNAASTGFTAAVPT